MLFWAAAVVNPFIMKYFSYLSRRTIIIRLVGWLAGCMVGPSERSPVKGMGQVCLHNLSIRCRHPLNRFSDKWIFHYRPEKVLRH